MKAKSGLMDRGRGCGWRAMHGGLRVASCARRVVLGMAGGARQVAHGGAVGNGDKRGRAWSAGGGLALFLGFAGHRPFYGD